MAVLTRKTVFAAIRSKYATPAQRKALTQRLGKPWNHASTEKLAQLVGLRGTPRKAQGAGRAKATAKQHGIARSFAAEQTASRMTDDTLKRSQIKARIVRSVKRELDATKKRLGRDLELKEKRAIAAKALSKEVKAIKAGVPESKGRKGKKPQLTAITGGGQGDRASSKIPLAVLSGGQPSPEVARRANKILTDAGLPAIVPEPKSSFGVKPPSGMSVAEYRQQLRRQYGAESGSRAEVLSKKEERRAALGRGETPGSDRKRAVADRIGQQNRQQDDIPFGYDTAARKPPAKRLDGKLNKQQQRALSAHLRKVASGEAKTVPLRAFQDKQGEHWLELRGKTGKIGAVPLDATGKQDNSRAVHSEAWDTKRKGMKTISVFPEGRGMAAPKKKPSTAQPFKVPAKGEASRSKLGDRSRGPAVEPKKAATPQKARTKATSVPQDNRDWKLPETPKSMRVNGRNID